MHESITNCNGSFTANGTKTDLHITFDGEKTTSAMLMYFASGSDWWSKAVNVEQTMKSRL